MGKNLVQNKLQLRTWNPRATLDALIACLVWVFVAVGMFTTYNYTTLHFPITTVWIGTVYRTALFGAAFWILFVRPFRDGFISAKCAGRTCADREKIKMPNKALHPTARSRSVNQHL